VKLCIVFFSVVVALAPAAGASQIHFDELGTSSSISANGIHVAGVLFQFSGGSAQYNGAIGSQGTTALVSDPLLVGDTSGILTLTFATPTPILTFDIAMESCETVPGAYTVTIPGSAQLVEQTSPIVLFSESEFVYSGSAPVSSAVITFSSAAPAFGLDNLTFDSSPEPGTALLLGCAFLGLAALTKRRKP